MNHRLSLFVSMPLRQPAPALARSVFVSEFSDHSFERDAPPSPDSRAGNLPHIRASISYQADRALRPAPDFTVRSTRRGGSQRVAFDDRSTRNGQNLSNVSLNRTLV